MKGLKKQYRDLETTVLAQLRDKINQSKIPSKHVNGNAIKVDVNGYKELVIVNDRLTFLDSGGYGYDVYTVSLEELIDILEPQK